MSKREQIAIDGPAASGKSTVAKLLAKKLQAYYVNTGDMYRALTMLCLEQNVDVNSAAEIENILANNTINYRANNETLELIINDKLADMQAVRDPIVAQNVSYVAKHPRVRDWMLGRQRAAADLGVIVMEGRDIGTVVFPEAKFKFYITATPMERARRRLAQPGESIDGATLEQVANEIAKRDKLDSERKVAPLKPASDAVTIDSTDMTIEQVIEQIFVILKNR